MGPQERRYRTKQHQTDYFRLVDPRPEYEIRLPHKSSAYQQFRTHPLDLGNIRSCNEVGPSGSRDLHSDLRDRGQRL